MYFILFRTHTEDKYRHYTNEIFSKEEDAISFAETIFICVGTPTKKNSFSADLSQVYKVTKEIRKNIKKFKVIVMKSTVPVTTGDEIEKILKAQKPNLAILGLGTDGHTASLFPGNPEIFNENDDVLLKTNNEWEDFDRVSLSFNYLMKSDKIIFMVSGFEKAEALMKCLAGDYDPIQFPAQFIINNYNNDIHILCDKAAGKYVI